MTKYPLEILDGYEDDGTMMNNVLDLKSVLIGAKIVKVEQLVQSPRHGDTLRRDWNAGADTILTLDNGDKVHVIDTHDCCASTEVWKFLLHADKIDHAITGVGTTDGYTKWHIFADIGDVLELDVNWSAGNPFYYSYGFYITVEPAN